MGDRLFGIETEYAVVPVPANAQMWEDCAAFRLLKHARAVLPSMTDMDGRSLFLQNGSRFYVDAGRHPEMTTPEVANPWDAVRYVLAGDRILAQLAGEIGGGTVLFKTNVDYGTGATWGCHESVMYDVRASERLLQVIPHLVSRVVFTGAGGFDSGAPGLRFTVSPRVAHLEQVVSGESTRCRGIFHTRQESLCSRGKYGRLHILCGESLRSEIASWLKVATTVLVVALIDGDVCPQQEVELGLPLEALRTFARDVTCKAKVPLRDGTSLTALNIQRRFLDRVEAHIGADFMPPWTATACAEWRRVLDMLDGAPDSVATTLDWAIKWTLYRRHAARHGLTWQEVADASRTLRQDRSNGDGEANGATDGQGADAADWSLQELENAVRAVAASKGYHLSKPEERNAADPFFHLRRELLETDMRFSQLGPGDLFGVLDGAGVLTHHMPGVDNIEHAIANPPAVGRARIRGEVIKRLESERAHYRCTWEGIVNSRDGTTLDLGDPLETCERWERGHVAVSPSPSGELSSYSLRSDALECFLAGRHDRAEELLRALLGQRFEVPSNLCHLARVLFVTGREAEARQQVDNAWALRHEAPRYVTGRALWFYTLFALIDGADARPWVGALKHLLAEGNADLDWSMEPVLAHLAGRLDPDTHALLATLVAVLSDALRIGDLDQFPQWQNAEARAIE